MFKALVILFVLLLAHCFTAGEAGAQTTEFTYQGTFKDGGNPANGNYDLEFKLFNLVSGGVQQGSTLQRFNVPVADGIVTVSLDFGAGALPGADRFLDIAVRPSSGGAFAPLSPRQKVNSAPYSFRSLLSSIADVSTNSSQLGGVAANQYVITTDPRMTDARNPLANSPNYSQNTAVQQVASNFNISGNGTAGGTFSGNIVNAATQFNLGGSRILTAGGILGTSLGLNAGTPASRSAFFGNSAGAVSTGNNNSFFGSETGTANTTGGHNSFFGTAAGNDTTTGGDNSFFGAFAGTVNTTGVRNAFLGSFSGQNNLTGTDNSFFGRASGPFNTAGSRNSFFGSVAGTDVQTGNENTFIGYLAGDGMVSGSGNSILGAFTTASADLTNATAIGYRASVTQSDSIVLGSINGVNGATASTNVGIGTTAPERKLHVRGPSSVEVMIESSDAGGRKWTLQSSSGGNNGRFEIIDRTAIANRFYHLG